MPVSSCSFLSSRLIHCWPFFERPISLSTPASNPSLMIPPSVMTTGGSSAIALSSNAPTSSIRSILAAIRCNNADFPFSSSTCLNAGSARSDSASARQSRALIVLYDIFAMIRSRSRICFRCSINTSRRYISSAISCTASRRMLIFSRSFNGRNMVFLSSRAPGDVRVLSSSQSNEPFLPPSIMVRVSSRFLIALLSSIIYALSLYVTIRLMCVSAFIWVSLKYCISAPAALTAPGMPAHPNASSFFTLKCFLRASVAVLGSYAQS